MNYFFKLHVSKMHMVLLEMYLLLWLKIREFFWGVVKEESSFPLQLRILLAFTCEYYVDLLIFFFFRTRPICDKGEKNYWDCSKTFGRCGYFMLLDQLYP